VPLRPLARQLPDGTRQLGVSEPLDEEGVESRPFEPRAPDRHGPDSQHGNRGAPGLATEAVDEGVPLERRPPHIAEDQVGIDRLDDGEGLGVVSCRQDDRSDRQQEPSGGVTLQLSAVDEDDAWRRARSAEIYSAASLRPVTSRSRRGRAKRPEGRDAAWSVALA